MTASAGLGGDGEDLDVGVAPPAEAADLIHVKVKVGQNVHFVDNQGIAHGEHQRVLQGLVMPLGDGEDHHVFGSAGVKLRRTNQIAHILQHRQIQVFGSQLAEPLPGHPGVQMAHAAGVELDGYCPGAGDGLGVHLRVDVCLHHTDAELALQGFNRPLQGGGLPGAGRGHQVHQEGLFCLQLRTQPIGLPVVVFKNTFLDLNYSDMCHALTFKQLHCFNFFDRVFIAPQQIGVFAAAAGADFCVLDGGIFLAAVGAEGDGLDGLNAQRRLRQKLRALYRPVPAVAQVFGQNAADLPHLEGDAGHLGQLIFPAAVLHCADNVHYGAKLMHSAFPQTLPWMRVAAPREILALIVEKGSICIDGISLTVAALDDDSFQVSIIPHTGSETTLLTKAVGDPVNLENDVVGKYVQRLLQPAIAATKPQESRITMEFLAEHGF